MQSDVTLVGGATPAATLPAASNPRKVVAQTAQPVPMSAPAIQGLTRPTNTTQTAAVTEAKIALATSDAPTAVSQGERVLKPYGVTILPDTPVDGSNEDLSGTQDAQ